MLEEIVDDFFNAKLVSSSTEAVGSRRDRRTEQGQADDADDRAVS
jgi:hypothetical protein